MDIKDIALRVAPQAWPDLPEHWFTNERNNAVRDAVIKFAEALVAEIQRQSEPVGYVTHDSTIPRDRRCFTDCSIIDAYEARDYKPECVTAVFTFPLDKDSIEQSVAEACAAYALDALDGFEDGQEMADAIRSGEWKKFIPKGE